MEAQTIELYDIAENDRGEVLVAMPDLKVDVEEATFDLQGDQLYFYYPDKRAICLPNLPQAAQDVLAKIDKILVVESTTEALVRAYDAVVKQGGDEADAPLPRRRSRPGRL